MNNKDIVKILKYYAKLYELTEDNSFKTKALSASIASIENQNIDLIGYTEEELLSIKGLGKSIVSKIENIKAIGNLEDVKQLEQKIPRGVIQMLELPGLGPSKVKKIWHDAKVESLDGLLVACKDNRIAQVKGLGQKTQENIEEAVAFKLSQKGMLLISEGLQRAQEIEKQFSSKLEGIEVIRVGALARQSDVMSGLEWIIAFEDKKEALPVIQEILSLEEVLQESGPFLSSFLDENQVFYRFHWVKRDLIPRKQVELNASAAHLKFLQEKGVNIYSFNKQIASENDFYKAFELPFVSAELREGFVERLDVAIEDLVRDEDLKGILHNHTTYSDGAHTLREMALACKERGYEYLGITDHSKTASYANGLYEKDIIRQMEEIDELNKELAPFKIFKGIESDILMDGSLDYSDEVLKSFDFIVASIHANLNMDEKKATERLLRAIANPHTTILGHPTGRLLLRRKGYPVNHKMIIDACAEHNVAIEINANPWRLDLDWRFIPYAIEKGVKIAINPDAHHIDGYEDMKYGVIMGRKGGLTKGNTLNAMSKDEIAQYFDKKKMVGNV
ncbi:MAG: PHP domain-containing protein [Cyclobacteriaceae bacterium]|nr:PHP domain-containing protein [Cyclobacteriaceae bacterium]MCH8515068.1 PHP domain-containing protein [Cyclobacteriaceae bacterium]